MTENTEFTRKRQKIAAWLESRSADAALVVTDPNVYWLALGGEVLRPTPLCTGFVVSAQRCFLLCPGEDADRVRQEEVRGLEVEIVPLPELGPAVLVQRARSLLPASARWRSDAPGLGLEHDGSFDALRLPLCPEEIERLRRLGRDAAAALEDVGAECFLGILERDAAARIAAECVRRHLVPRAIVTGADERFQTYPRPLPKGGSAERMLMLSLVAMRGGLHVALSRSLCFVPPENAFLECFAGAQVLAARLCHESMAGGTLGEAVQRALPRPAVPRCSLGGVLGYAFPETEVTSASPWRLGANQALAFSVCSPGVRCEDSWLLLEQEAELLTGTDTWPTRSVRCGDRSIGIPDLLQL